jgi:hypothetical protein
MRVAGSTWQVKAEAGVKVGAEVLGLAVVVMAGCS